MKPDVHFKKTVQFKFARQVLQFRVSQDLFSSHDVDIGTRRLLRSLAGPGATPFRRVLDLGCGYGPIGLTLKMIDGQRTVDMVDRDALALAYARQNSALNGLPDVAVYGSLGYDDLLAADFDLIVSNIPAKAGEPVIASLLREAACYLNPQGFVAIVVVTPIETLVAGILADPAIEVLLRKDWPGHVVFHYRFSHGQVVRPERSALERGVYDRGTAQIAFRELVYPLRTAHDLPEFDGLGYRTELLLRSMLDLEGAAVGRALVFNPGQGHVPVVLWKQFAPAEISLVDRDLLALRYSRRNLVLNGCPETQITLSHQVGVPAGEGAPAGLVAGVLREEEGPAAVQAVIEGAARQVAPDGIILAAGSSTAVTRVVKWLQSTKVMRVVRRERSKGESLLVLRRR